MKKTIQHYPEIIIIPLSVLTLFGLIYSFSIYLKTKDFNPAPQIQSTNIGAAVLDENNVQAKEVVLPIKLTDEITALKQEVDQVLKADPVNEESNVVTQELVEKIFAAANEVAALKGELNIKRQTDNLLLDILNSL